MNKSSLCVWQAAAFAEAPVERGDEITYFGSPAVEQRAVLKISNLSLTTMIELADCNKAMCV